MKPTPQKNTPQKPTPQKQTANAGRDIIQVQGNFQQTKKQSFNIALVFFEVAVLGSLVWGISVGLRSQFQQPTPAPTTQTP
ncbi:MAG: hypothetical protein VKJ24_03855 [Synechococcales bacterium]|nr:hypothetical protein [Synechococcales bacterium]